MEEGITRDDIHRILAEIALPEEMQDALRALAEQQHVRVRVVSDANTFFIESILESFNLKHTVETIVTNPGVFDASGIH